MALTAQELIEQSRQREEAIKTAKKGIGKERIERFKSYFKKPMPVSRTVKKADVKVGATVRKAIHLVAPKGLAKTLTQPKGKSKGRGRPAGTYKVRYVPGVGAVKVPTHIYKRMLAEAKAKRRLAEAQRQAQYQQQYEAEQIAMSQDPRFQPSAEDAWAEGEDMDHQAEVMQTKQRMLQQQYLQQMQQEQQPTTASRAGEMFNRTKLSLMGTDRKLQQQMLPQQRPQFQQMQRPQVQSLQRPQVQPLQRPQLRPQVMVTSGKSPMFSSGGPSILSQGNEFNRRNEATIGFGR